MDYTERIPQHEEGETMKEYDVIGTLVSPSGIVRWVVEVVALANDFGDAIPGVGFLTTDPIPTNIGVHDPVCFDNGHGKMFLVREKPTKIVCYTQEYEPEGEPTPEDIAYVNYTLDITYSTTN
jgi:hypothetical protein